MKFQTPLPVRLKKILVAEDNASLRLLIVRVLLNEDCEVCTASDGEEAWDELHREPYDLLITDNEMPRLHGLKLIERLRAAGMTLPVILASGSISTETARHYPNLDITAVVPKPFNLWEFLDAIRAALHFTPKKKSSAKTSPSWRQTSMTVGPVKTEHRHVLIADDDAVVRGSLAAVLQSEGYEVDEASDGIEAVLRALKHKPDLVLLDLNMPNADGWAAFNQLDRVAPLLPVIVITARPNQYAEAVRVGVDAFMEKPLNIPMLVRAVKQMTDEEEGRHIRRITNRAFVTELLAEADF